MAELKDSGVRQAYGSAVRDSQEGRGRADLLPLDVVGLLFLENKTYTPKRIFDLIDRFQKDGDPAHLLEAVHKFVGTSPEYFESIPTMLLELSIHFEDGARKYNERNWEGGIPIPRFISSAVRHYLKYLRGDTDEPHHRSFCWNLICCAWTCKHHPELNPYGKEREDLSLKEECFPKGS